MQARELTPSEIADGERHINEMELSATQVQALVRNMDISKKRYTNLKRQGKKLEYEESIKKENEILYFNYPSLFQLHLEDRLDSTFFEMLTLKRRIEKGEITAEQASGMIGQALFNRYIPPSLGQAPPEAPRMRYEDFYKQNQE
jgi:hypothetical protein